MNECSTHNKNYISKYCRLEVADTEHMSLLRFHQLQDLNGEVNDRWSDCFSADENVPPDVPRCTVGWSCPGATSLPPGSPSPILRAEMAGQCRCPGRTHPCPHWSARSHRHLLQDKTVSELC